MNTTPGPTAHQELEGLPTNLRVDDIITFGENQRQTMIPRWLFLVALVIGQALLARFMSQQPRLGLLQAGIICALVGYAVLRRDMVRLLLLIAYLPATEIVWRQCNVPVPYLIAPYLLVSIGILAMFTMYSRITRPARLAIYYVLLLLPSMIVTISTAGGRAREPIAFALSGPIALAALVLLFTQIKIEPWLYKKMMWVMVISGIGPLAVALTGINDYIVANGELQFGDKSNFITSGGFGPVQVSAVMGLTVLCCVLLYLAEREMMARLLAAVIGLVAATQSFLTFSRGGMFATALALAALVITQAASPESRRRVIAVVLVVFTIGYFVVVPWVDAFTKGQFEKRFTDTSSGRTDLAVSDVEIFRDNLAFGVGPGMSKFRRLTFEVCQIRKDKCTAEGSSHTEFTRMLSEHGLSGAVAIIVVLTLAFRGIRRAGPSMSINLTFLTWAIAQMFYANLRVSAVPITFALAFLRIEAVPVNPDQLLPDDIGGMDLQTVLASRDRYEPPDLFALS